MALELSKLSIHPFLQNVMHYCSQKGDKLIDLPKKIGFAVGMLEIWRRGHGIRPKYVKMLAEYFGVSPEELTDYDAIHKRFAILCKARMDELLRPEAIRMMQFFEMAAFWAIKDKTKRKRKRKEELRSIRRHLSQYAHLDFVAEEYNKIMGEINTLLNRTEK